MSAGFFVARWLCHDYGSGGLNDENGCLVPSGGSDGVIHFEAWVPSQLCARDY